MDVDASGTGRGCYPRGRLVASRLVAAPDVTVVVLTWNTRDLTRAALAAVAQAAAPFTCQTICVDNASTDGTAEAVRACLPAVEVIRLPSNLGFARGNDAALPRAQGRVIVFLNSDTEARPGSLAHVVRYLDAHPGVGIAVPSLVGPDGRPQRASWGEPTVAAAFHAYTPLGWLGLGGAAARRQRGDRAPLPHTGPVEVASGACLAIRRDLCDRLGGFDPGYPFYFEDVDLCRRARRAGYEVHEVADGPPVLHHGGASAALSGGVLRISLLQGLLRFHRQGLDPRAYAWFSPALRAGVVARSLAEILRAPVTWALRRLRGRPERAARAIDTARQRATFLERDVLRWLRVETGTRATSSPGAPGPGRRR